MFSIYDEGKNWGLRTIQTPAKNLPKQRAYFSKWIKEHMDVLTKYTNSVTTKVYNVYHITPGVNIE